MLTVLEAANHLIIAHQSRGGLNHKRLHCLLYLAQGFAQVTDGLAEVVLDEQPRAYGYGPIYESLYTRQRKAPDAHLFEPYRKRFTRKIPLPDIVLDRRATAHFDMVHRKFHHMLDAELAAYCCQPGGAWDKTSVHKAIPLSDMAREFDRLFHDGLSVPL